MEIEILYVDETGKQHSYATFTEASKWNWLNDNNNKVSPDINMALEIIKRDIEKSK